MPSIRGITVSIGYAPLLAATLVRNMRHMEECVVVTAPEDEATQEVVASVPGTRLHVTDAHRRHGARFNKGLAMEEGFDVLGRRDWILIWDADCIFPDSLDLSEVRPGPLYGARRRMLDDPAAWHPDLDWATCPEMRDGGPIGFFQLFHADSPHLVGKRPWYDVSFAHAGGGDAAFMRHWPSVMWKVLPIDVLHLGPNDTNWFGTDPEGRDVMAAFVHRAGWRRAMKKADASAVGRVGEIKDRVEVPGYPRSNFTLGINRRRLRRGPNRQNLPFPHP